MSKKKLKVLYKEMFNLTQEKCSTCDTVTCCSEYQCLLTKEITKKTLGIDLELPFLVNNKCRLEPHLRQMCTLHICEKHYMFDIDFNERYFLLRDKISLLEFEIGVK